MGQAYKSNSILDTEITVQVEQWREGAFKERKVCELVETEGI